MKRVVEGLKGLILALLLLSFLLSGYLLFFSKSQVYGLDSLKSLPKEKTVVLRLSDNVSHVEIYLLQKDKKVRLLSQDLGDDKEVSVKIKPEKLGLEEGKARVVLELKRFGILTDRLEVNTLIDTKPPRINIIKSQYAVYQGGTGALRVKSSEPVKLSVKVGERLFKAYEVGNNTFISVFPIPVDTPPNTYVYVVAEDGAGNRSITGTGTRVKAFKFKSYTINLDGRELKIIGKLKEILGEDVSPDNFVEAFKKVNEQVRQENEEKIRELASDSLEKKLWEGKFLQLRNSKVVSLFGERRSYRYKGKFVSSSVHWGYDLASVKNAPVEAANSGRVIFTGYIGIYGNVVLIDHGFGIVSLYAHLAEFKVKRGDKVKKGQIIGITDATGLAFGDHLHFGVLVQGVEVNPIEWWDAKWVERNIQTVF